MLQTSTPLHDACTYHAMVDGWDRRLRGDLSELEPEECRHPLVRVLADLAGLQLPSPSLTSSSAPELPDSLRSRFEGLVAVRAFLAQDHGMLRADGSARARRLDAVLHAERPPELSGRKEAIDIAVDALAASHQAPSEAVRLARTAVRMARSDGFLFDEYFASLALARVRRFVGHPHLAERILQGLGQVLPSPWQSWCSFEKFMSGGRVSLSGDWPFAQAISEVMNAVDFGNTQNARQAAERLVVPKMFQHEVDLLLVALGLFDPRESTVAIEPWCAGHSCPPPAPIAGFCAPQVLGQDHRSNVIVLLRADHPPRRLLADGIKLFGLDANMSLSAERDRTTRALLEVAASGGIQRAELFRKVYGFDYRSTAHSGTLRVLLHRVRKFHPALSLVESAKSTLRIEISEPCVLPDPEHQLALDQIVLHHLARSDQPQRAAEIARALQISVRAVRNALTALGEEGLCEVERSGREVRYAVEDTTFHRPTLERMTWVH